MMRINKAWFPTTNGENSKNCARANVHCAAQPTTKSEIRSGRGPNQIGRPKPQSGVRYLGIRISFGIRFSVFGFGSVVLLTEFFSGVDRLGPDVAEFDGVAVVLQ